MAYRKIFDSYERMRDWFHLNDLIDEVAAGQVPCRQAPDLYFPDQREGQAAMLAKMTKQACQTCEVIKECGAYALKHKEEDGVWGGMTPNDRRAIWGMRKK